MKYLLKVTSRIFGEDSHVSYHADITPTERLDTNNMYVQHLTTDKKKALQFFDKEEAVRVGLFFKTRFNTFEIIEIN